MLEFLSFISASRLGRRVAGVFLDMQPAVKYCLNLGPGTGSVSSHQTFLDTQIIWRVAPFTGAFVLPLVP